MATKLNICSEPWQKWFDNSGEKLFIAGPCSAESEEQMLSTANGLKNANVSIFRAGIWKPRTRPNTFEGVGFKGLQWLKRVKEETGLRTATEVANVKHVYECLKAGVDVLWIGARTTVNPFAVQEIAEALRGVDTVVLVKNPINPDIELWIGALERFSAVGITKLGAIHRGFSFYEKAKFRNPPQWEIPIELKRRLPHMPLISDPSHICGNREGLADIAQKAMDLNFDGLIIESHVDPDKAWSDASQQITPKVLLELLDKLILRHETDSHLINPFDEIRAQIDRDDEALVNLLGHRMKLAEQIGEQKKVSNITILQSSRWNEILEKRIEQGNQNNLGKEFITKIFEEIHKESIEKQMRIMNEAAV